MADSLGNILQTKRFDEPAEVLVIKKFLHTHYKADCQVAMQTANIIISVRGASLAGALRIRLHELQTLCQTDKRLMIRIV